MLPEAINLSFADTQKLIVSQLSRLFYWFWLELWKNTSFWKATGKWKVATGVSLHLCMFVTPLLQGPTDCRLTQLFFCIDGTNCLPHFQVRGSCDCSQRIDSVVGTRLFESPQAYNMLSAVPRHHHTATRRPGWFKNVDYPWEMWQQLVRLIGGWLEPISSWFY